MTRPPAGQWLSTNGLRYRYRRAGPATSRRRPLVLVHGLGVSSVYFARLQWRLARERPVYAVDLPGCGESDKPPHALNVPAQAGALDAWLAAARLAEVDLLGHSLGGQVVAELARRHPERVGRLVLAAPTLGKRGRGALRGWLNLLRDALREPLSLYPAVIPAYLRCGPWRILHTDVLADTNDLATTLRQVARPLLIVRGTRDCVVPRTDLEALLGRIPRAVSGEITGAAHALHWSHADALARLVDSFLTDE